MKPTIPDPVIDEIRAVRHRISASCDHDPAKLVQFLMQYQEQFRDRLIYVPTEPTHLILPAADPALALARSAEATSQP